MVDRDLTQLTQGERLWIERRRRGETQAQAARRLGVSERRYNHAETGRRTLEGHVTGVRHAGPAYLLALARRRDGRPLRALAGVLGVGSHVTLLAWEAKAHPLLQAAWERLGYKFN